MYKKSLNAVLIGIFLLLTGCKAGKTETPISPTPTFPATPEVISETLSPTITPLPTKPMEPAPTIDTDESIESGKIVFYSERDGNPEIYTMNPDGSDQTRLTFNSFEDSSPVWSPDGNQIAFISDRDDPQPGKCFPNCLYQIYMINADGSDEHKLVETEFATLHPDWHPDGTMLSFDAESNFQGNIYRVNADGSELHLLIEDGFWADWSPDGSQIAFASKLDGLVDIYIADADGTNQRRLTDNQRSNFFPAWSPDGKKIAYMSGQAPRMQLYIINKDGSDEQQLTSKGRVNEDPDWSPDGSRIVFQSNRDGNFEIYTLEIDAILRGESDLGLQRLTNTNGGDFWPSWGLATMIESNSPILFEKSKQAFPSVPTWKIGLADLDHDGDLDAIFANGQSNDSQVWLNDGNGTFTDTGQQMGKFGHGVDVGDLDGDSDLDVIISTHTDSAVTRVYLNDGSAMFQELEDAFNTNLGFSVELLDIDGDGDLDAVGEDTSATNVYLNDGMGYFALSQISFPLTTIWGDLDVDGDMDVFIKEEGVGYSIQTNDGTGNFNQYWNHADATAMLLGDVALADVDNDGDLDAIITNGHFQSTSFPALVFFNDGTGQFIDSGQQLSAVRNAGVSLGDLDRDGDLDLVLSDYMEPNQIWLNDGAGQFVDSGFRFGGDQFYRHIHLGDLDIDGDIDIFLATFGTTSGSNEIWFNQSFKD
jgi:Tol biopolymer transport system component